MITRRRFIQGTAASAAALGLYTWQVEPRWVEHVALPLPIRNLPAALVGRTLVHISDLHIGNRIDYRYQFDHFEQIKTAAPDYVVYTGDFVSYNDAEQLDQLREAAVHFPQGTRGTAAILGNHDYGHGWQQMDVAEAITTVLTDNNIPVLRNQVQVSDQLQFVGLNDFWSPEYDAEGTLGAADFALPTIVLCHNPDVVDKPVWYDYQGWILCGHTHGGQVKAPFLPPPMLPVSNRTYTRGRFDLADGRKLYINRGLGHVWQLRFNVRPEITWFTLENAAE